MQDDNTDAAVVLPLCRVPRLVTSAIAEWEACEVGFSQASHFVVRM